MLVQDNEWDVEHGSAWNANEDESYIDVKDAGWCEGDCRQFRATPHPANYFVTFKYKINDEDCDSDDNGTKI